MVVVLADGVDEEYKLKREVFHLIDKSFTTRSVKKVVHPCLGNKL